MTTLVIDYALTEDFMHERDRFSHAALSCLAALSTEPLGLDHSADGKINSTAARNLTILAGMLGTNEMTVCEGYVYGDDQIVARAAARADGKLVLVTSAFSDITAACWNAASDWKFAIGEPDSERFAVTLIPGEFGDDDVFVIADAAEFYRALLEEQKPEPKPMPRPHLQTRQGLRG